MDQNAISHNAPPELENGLSPVRTSNNTELVDITKRFIDSCQNSLYPGDLVYCAGFSLQHAMSAIEILDPKMDIRVCYNRRIISVKEAVLTGSLPLGPFPPEELLGIVDELLASTVNWLTGDSLAQTVFTCMYMHCSQLIRDQYLHLHCELLRRVIRHVKHFLLRGYIFDEEDHYAFTHNVPLDAPDPAYDQYKCSDIPDLTSYSTNDLYEYTQSILTDSTIFSENTVCSNALRNRLEFMYSFIQLTDALFHAADSATDQSDLEDNGYQTVYCNNKPSTPNNTSPTTGCEDINQFWSTLANTCVQMQSLLKRLVETSQELCSSASAGMPAGPGKINAQDEFYGLPGFEPFLNQNHLPSFIAKFVIIHDRSKAFAYFHKLFSELFTITSTLLELTSWHEQYPATNIMNLVLSYVQSRGQSHCSYFEALFESKPENTPKVRSYSMSCVFARSFFFTLLWKFNLGCREIENIPSLKVQLVFQSWSRFECEKYRSIIWDVITESMELTSFAELSSDVLLQIPRVYFLNRSRQHSALLSLLEKLPSTLEDCIQAECFIRVELAKRLCCGSTDDDISNIIDSVPIHMTKYACYLYCHAAWDALIAGFQLDLYAWHEWLFIYTFMVQVIKKLSDLLAHFSYPPPEPLDGVKKCETSNATMTSCKSNSFDGDRVTRTESDTGCHTSDAMSKSYRRKKKNKRQAKHRPIQSSEEQTENKVSLSKTTMAIEFLFEIGSNLEASVLSCHGLLVAGTIYAIRALQLDSGGDPVFDCTISDCAPKYANYEEIYKHRLGLFLLPRTSPLFDSSGVRGSFNACVRYLTGELFQVSKTSELYSLAARTFDNARLRAQHTLKQKQDAAVLFTGTIDETTRHHFGSPDSLNDLLRLASHNAIACRVLSTCPDRRPKPQVSTKLSESSCNICLKKPSFLLSSSSVVLNFDSLPSRTYPLIRLVNSNTA